MITVFLILSMLFTFFGIVFFSDKEYEDTKLAVFCTIMFCISFVISVAYWTQNAPREHNLKDYSLKTEVRANIINGKEVSRDTVYIFTPKKK